MADNSDEVKRETDEENSGDESKDGKQSTHDHIFTPFLLVDGGIEDPEGRTVKIRDSDIVR